MPGERGEHLVEIAVEDERWTAAGLAATAEAAARAALAAAGLAEEECEISLLAADDARLAELNASFRGKPAPTNVLSWPAFEPKAPGRLPRHETPPVFLGDIALAFETCSREAEAAGISLCEHTAHLVVHGVLHLLGYDHAADEDAAEMEALEVKALASMGVSDPYTR